MHRFSSRVTALVAASVALSLASMLAAAPRFENGRDLDSVIRKTRSGPQRDAGDAIDHHFEITAACPTTPTRSCGARAW